MSTYSDKLKDPRWQRKRLEILERDQFKCRHCRSAEKTLHVHHRIYRKGKMPWDYEDQVFVSLCEECHTEAEKTKEELLLLIGRSRHGDRALINIAKAIKEDPVGITFFGWAATSLAHAVGQQIAIMNDDGSDDTRSICTQEMNEYITEAIDCLHRAKFYVEENYPEL